MDRLGLLHGGSISTKSVFFFLSYLLSKLDLCSSDTSNILPTISTDIQSVQFSSVKSLSRVRLFATPWTAARQASLSITNSRSPPKPMSIESVMPSNHLILCHPPFLLPSIFRSIRVFSNESALHIRWPKNWSFSFNIPGSWDNLKIICSWKK